VLGPLVTPEVLLRSVQPHIRPLSVQLGPGTIGLWS
jgi:hypothetical protein